MRARHLAAVAIPLLLVAGGALAALGTMEGERPSESGPALEPMVAAAPDAGAVFIAFARDFRDFRSWEQHHVDGAMMPVGAAEGPTYVYLNRRAPEGTTRWPVGTIVVKAIQSGAPSQWTVHAMVKRGIPFNADGALGWEYFELAFPDEGDEPAVVWRGSGPPSGHGYAARGRDAGGGIPLVCDDCHAPAWRNDSVLTPAIALRD